MSATVWAYPWDLVDDGVAMAAARALDAEDLVSAALAAKGDGIEHAALYNRGVLPQARLEWLSQAAEAFRS